MRSYETARNLYNFLGYCATAVIVLGVIVAIMGGSATQALGRNAGAMQFIMGALPGLLIALAGTYGQAMVQMGRTSVDTAEYAQQSLAVSRQQLEISKQALAQGQAIAASYTSAKISMPLPPENNDLVDPDATYDNQPGSTAPVEIPEVQLSGPSGETLETTTPTSMKIILRDGSYHVGNRAFKTKEAAENYVGLLGVNPNTLASSETYLIGGRKLTKNPDGSLVLDGRSFSSLEAVKKHLRLLSSSGPAARKSL